MRDGIIECGYPPEPDVGREELVTAQESQLSAWQRLQAVREQHPYLATIAETAMVWAGREAATAVINSNTSIRVGHGWKDSRVGRIMCSPAAAVTVGMVLSPLVEERICREEPSRYLDATNRQGPQKLAGTVVAAAFAAGHAGREALPAPQFVGGLNYWRLQRTRGHKHAVLAHGLHNTLAFVASRLKQSFGTT